MSVEDRDEILWAIEDVKREKKQLTLQVSELNFILRELKELLNKDE